MQDATDCVQLQSGFRGRIRKRGSFVPPKMRAKIHLAEKSAHTKRIKLQFTNHGELQPVCVEIGYTVSASSLAKR